MSSPPITAHLQHHAVAGAVDQHAPRHADAVQHGARHQVHHCGSTRVTCQQRPAEVMLVTCYSPARDVVSAEEGEEGGAGGGGGQGQQQQQPE